MNQNLQSNKSLKSLRLLIVVNFILINSLLLITIEASVQSNVGKQMKIFHDEKNVPKKQQSLFMVLMNELESNDDNNETKQKSLTAKSSSSLSNISTNLDQTKNDAKKTYQNGTKSNETESQKNIPNHSQLMSTEKASQKLSPTQKSTVGYLKLSTPSSSSHRIYFARRRTRRRQGDITSAKSTRPFSFNPQPFSIKRRQHSKTGQRLILNLTDTNMKNLKNSISNESTKIGPTQSVKRHSQDVKSVPEVMNIPEIKGIQEIKTVPKVKTDGSAIKIGGSNVAKKRLKKVKKSKVIVIKTPPSHSGQAAQLAFINALRSRYFSKMAPLSLNGTKTKTRQTHQRALKQFTQQQQQQNVQRPQIFNSHHPIMDNNNHVQQMSGKLLQKSSPLSAIINRSQIKSNGDAAPIQVHNSPIVEHPDLQQQQPLPINIAPKFTNQLSVSNQPLIYSNSIQSANNNNNHQQKSSIKEFKDVAPKRRRKQIKTLLPVGLTSWMLGGIRDLDGRHWHLPSEVIDRLVINDVDFHSSSSRTTTEFPLVSTATGQISKKPKSEQEREEIINSPSSSSPTNNNNNQEQTVNKQQPSANKSDVELIRPPK